MNTARPSERSTPKNMPCSISEPAIAEGLVNYALSIQGDLYGRLFAEAGGMIKISFRSEGLSSW